MDAGTIQWASFFKVLETRIAECGDKGGVVALFVIQLRHHSLYNYRLGFEGGEAVIQEIARRAELTFKKGSVLQRIAPDRLGAVLLDIKVPELLPLVAKKLAVSLAEPFVVEGRPVTIDTGIGFALYPSQGGTGEALMSEAEVSLGVASRGTNRRFKMPNKTFSEKHLSRLQIENDLQVAIANGNLTLSYQPKVDLRKLEPVASEALIRWVREDGENVTPDQFIHIAEATGDIDALTEWVVNTALRETSQLPGGENRYAVGVNISAPSIYDAGFLTTVERALDIWDIPPTSFTIEITESVFAKDTETCFRHLSQLRELGVKISIDDFGTGFSSLSYFKNIPADEIKIDQSFISSICQSVEDRKIVEAIIDLSHKFDLSVVAEGIEDAATLEALCAMGCDIGQGYYLAKPMSFHRYREWLENGGCSHLSGLS